MTSKELLEKIKQFKMDIPDFVEHYEDDQQSVWKFKGDKVTITTGDGGAKMMLEALYEAAKKIK